MRKCVFVILFTSLLLANGAAMAQSGFFNTLKGAVQGVVNKDEGGSVLSQDDIIAGLREALRVGSERVVGQLGTQDGYNTDTDIHIPLPPQLQDVQKTLRKFHLSGLADDVELKINRAAEAAAPKTKELILKAINEMTIDDAKRIYDGPDDAATQYFRKVSTTDLTNVVRPIVENTLNEVGAVAAYDGLTSQYNALPFIPDLKGDLTNHAVDGALEGLFHYLAVEEAAIRQNPAKRTTEILTRVFGGQ